MDSLDVVYALLQRGRIQEAERVARGVVRTAEAELVDRADSLRWADALDGLIRSLTEGPRVGAAQTRQLIDQAITLRETLQGPEHADVSNGLMALGRMHWVLGEYAAAEVAYQRALAIRERAPGLRDLDVAPVLNNLASLYSAQGRYGLAEPLYQRVIAIYQEHLDPENLRLASGLNNLAVLYRTLGEYQRAEALFRRTHAILAAVVGSEHPNTATVLNNLALLYRDLGQHARAEQLMQQVLATRLRTLGEDHPQVAHALLNLGLIYDDLGRYAEAEDFQQRAIAHVSATLTPDHPSLTASLSNLGGTYLRQGQYARAAELFLRSLAIAEQTLDDRHPRVATALTHLADVRRREGRHAEAESLVVRALTISDQVLRAEHPLAARRLTLLALIRGQQGGFAAGIPPLERAAQIFESARLATGPGLERATFQQAPYPYLAAFRLLTGDEAGAWPAVERDRGRVLADLLLQGDQRQLAAHEAAHADSLARFMDDLENRLSAQLQAATAESAPADGDAATWDEIRLQLLVAQAAWSRFQREMAEKYPVTEGQAFPLERVQAALGPRTAILGWLDVELQPGFTTSWAYVVREDGPVEWVTLRSVDGSDARPADLLTPTVLAQRWRAELATHPGSAVVVSAAAEAVAADRVHPVLPLLTDIDELVVIPSGVISGIPVESLPDPQGHHLGDRFTVSYTPSATVMAWLHERRGERAGDRAPTAALLVGDPPFATAHLPAVATLRDAVAGDPAALALLPRLPGTRDEIQAIAALAERATILLGDAATEQELIRLARNGDLAAFGTIHLATHALADPERPERSSLVLSQIDLPDPLEAALGSERVYDGRLTVQEILREWRLDADLVTLSACETGLGRQVHGEGTVGFAHAFLQVGARALLVSLWKVDDQATSLLMERFYTGYWQHGVGKAAALQEAKVWLREHTLADGRRPFAHPYYWSAFVLIGDRH